jgi:hypothetical protein
VLQLRKVVYALHQAPQAWNTMLEDTLFSLGFQRTPSEHAIYVRRTCNALLVVRVYVDDLFITDSDCDDIKLFNNEMTSRTSLSQGAYARKLPERCGLARCIHCQMPMEARATPIKQRTQPLVDATTHLSIIRNLRYLVNTHPDLVFAIGYVSHFLEEPWEDHLAAVKRILRYVASTSNWGLWSEFSAMWWVRAIGGTGSVRRREIM